MPRVLPCSCWRGDFSRAPCLPAPSYSCPSTTCATAEPAPVPASANSRPAPPGSNGGGGGLVLHARARAVGASRDDFSRALECKFEGSW